MSSLRDDETPALEDPIVSLAREFDAGARSTLAWALVYAPSGGDPLPEAWRACVDPIAMVALLEHVRRESLTAALDRMTKHADTYPYARECFASAAQDLRWGRRGRSASWARDALTHFPGRGTAQPRPERAEALRASLCVVLRELVPELTLAELG